MESTVPEYTEAGIIRERTGSVLPKIAPSNVYPCADGEILIGANQDSVWSRMAEVMGKPELGSDPRYNSHVARGEHQAELDALIGKWTINFAANDLLALLEAGGVPAGKIFKAPDMMADPHFAARHALQKVAHPEFANLWMQSVFPKLSQTPGEISWPGPDLGAHNEEIFGALLGLDSAQRAELTAAGVI